LPVDLSLQALHDDRRGVRQRAIENGAVIQLAIKHDYDADVIIAGAGPAGVAAACHLERNPRLNRQAALPMSSP
jgi:NADH dehydrogenase FAD-containing subunit